MKLLPMFDLSGPDSRILIAEERRDLDLPTSFSFQHGCSDTERKRAEATCRNVTVGEVRMAYKVARRIVREMLGG